jgi:hypothetical protein
VRALPPNAVVSGLAVGLEAVEYGSDRSGSMVYGTRSGPERRRHRLRYRFKPPIPLHLQNRFQRAIWRLQRLVLGDNGHRR